mgnify:CR=1 FL=1
MAATGVLAEAYDNVCTRLADAGMVVVKDPRNARPMSVFVEVPTATTFNSNIVDVTIVCRILAGGAANSDASDYLLTQADIIHENVEGIIDVRPSSAIIGDQTIPAYDLTVRISTRRN